jgi:F-type H+-transporting ATPase subunit 8
MNSTRFMRPLARAFGRPTLVRPSAIARPTLIAGQTQASQKTSPAQQMTVVRSAMPQLIPFFFVNETTYAFILIPSLIYVMTKYILPQKMRMMAARLFISKL